MLRFPKLFISRNLKSHVISTERILLLLNFWKRSSFANVRDFSDYQLSCIVGLRGSGSQQVGQLCRKRRVVQWPVNIHVDLMNFYVAESQQVLLMSFLVLNRWALAELSCVCAQPWLSLTWFPSDSSRLAGLAITTQAVPQWTEEMILGHGITSVTIKWNKAWQCHLLWRTAHMM